MYILTVHTAKSQNPTVKLLTVVGSLPSSTVKNAKDLKVKILVKNKRQLDIDVYKVLVEGYSVDPSANLNLLVQQNGRKGFHEYSRGGSYQMVQPDPGDPIEKIKLRSGDSLAHYFYLDDVYLFVPGSYRLKCFYKNDISEKDKISSSWIYFQVINKIPMTHHYND